MDNERPTDRMEKSLLNLGFLPRICRERHTSTLVFFFVVLSCRNITFRLWTDVAIDCLGLWHRNWLIFFHLPAAAVLCDDGARTRVVGQPDVFCGWLLLLLLLAHYCSWDCWMAGRRDGTGHDITVLVRYDWRQIEKEMMPIRNQ